MISLSNGCYGVNEKCWWNPSYLEQNGFPSDFKVSANLLSGVKYFDSNSGSELGSGKGCYSLKGFLPPYSQVPVVSVLRWSNDLTRNDKVLTVLTVRKWSCVVLNVSPGPCAEHGSRGRTGRKNSSGLGCRTVWRGVVVGVTTTSGPTRGVRREETKRKSGGSQRSIKNLMNVFAESFSGVVSYWF